jgi:hypothetical protein
MFGYSCFIFIKLCQSTVIFFKASFLISAFFWELGPMKLTWENICVLTFTHGTHVRKYTAWHKSWHHVWKSQCIVRIIGKQGSTLLKTSTITEQQTTHINESEMNKILKKDWLQEWQLKLSNIRKNIWMYWKKIQINR